MGGLNRYQIDNIAINHNGKVNTMWRFDGTNWIAVSTPTPLIKTEDYIKEKGTGWVLDLK
jgi:hypothetical protein